MGVREGAMHICEETLRSSMLSMFQDPHEDNVLTAELVKGRMVDDMRDLMTDNQIEKGL